MPQVALYARVSSDQQAKFNTIDSQVSALQRHAKEQGLLIEDDMIFLDNGVSGAILERVALDRLRDKASRREVDTVLIHSPDRLARKHAHQLILIEEFSRLGVDILFVNHPISSSPEDQLLLQIQGVISEYEREKIMERSRRGKLHKARQGNTNVLSGAPYGYVYIKKTETESSRYEIHFEQARIVKEVFRQYAVESKSIGAIARHLNEHGVPTRKQLGQWERSTIWGMLKNPAYTGRAAFRKTRAVTRDRPTKLARDNHFYPIHGKGSARARDSKEWISIPVPAIIDEHTFKVVQQRLQENKKLSPRNTRKNEYLLSGLIHCKECGYALYGKPASGSRYNRRYYRCMGQDGYRWPTGRVCSQTPVRVEVLDEMVWDQTKKLIESPALVVEEYARRSTQRQSTITIEDLIKEKSKEIHLQGIEKERLLDLYQKGIFTLKELESRVDGIRKKIRQLTDEHEMLDKEKEQKLRQLHLIEQFESFKTRFDEGLDHLTFKDRQMVTRLLVSEAIVDVKNTDILVRHIIRTDKMVPLCTGSD